MASYISIIFGFETTFSPMPTIRNFFLLNVIVSWSIPQIFLPFKNTSLGNFKDTVFSLQKFFIVSDTINGFMTENEFYSVIENYVLPDGRLFSIPIILDISKESANDLKINSNVKLLYDNNEIGEMLVKSIFSCDKKKCVKKIYGTNDIKHPGVNAFYKTKDVFIGGRVRIIKKAPV